MKKILLGYKFKPEGFKDLEDKFELTYPENERFTKEEMIALLPQMDVLVPNFSFQTDKDVIDAGKNLKIIANFGVGYNNIDVAYAASKAGHSLLKPLQFWCKSLSLQDKW